MPENSDIADLQFWGALSSLFGLALSFIGFWCTISNSRKAKSAADIAAKAADEAAESANKSLHAIQLQDNTISFMQLQKIADELRRDTNNKDAQLIFERCLQLKGGMIALRAKISTGHSEHVDLLTKNIQRISKIDHAIYENNAENDPSKPNWLLIHKTASSLADDLAQIASETAESLKGSI